MKVTTLLLATVALLALGCTWPGQDQHESDTRSHAVGQGTSTTNAP